MRDTGNPYGTQAETPSLGDVEAEFALLGAILCDNSVLPMVDSIITDAAFFEPVAGRLYAAARALVMADRAVDPVILANELTGDPALAALGGIRLLGEMVDKAPPSSSAVDYARLIRELWQRRSLVSIGRELAKQALGAGIKSGDLIDLVERELLGLQTIAREVALVSAADAVERVVAELEDPGLSRGVRLGLDKFDEATGGLMPGELWLIAGRPSMGKSALFSTGARNVATYGRAPDGRRQGVIMINMEMGVAAMTRRLITDAAYDFAGPGAPVYSDVRKRRLTDPERGAFYTASRQIHALETLKMIYRPGLTLTGIRGLIRRQRAAWERQGIALALVGVDHVGLVRSEADSRARGRTEAQTDLAIAAKETAGDLDVPLIALAQLNRQVESREDKRPQLSDMRDSGAWEENADAVVGIYRDAYYANREPEPKKYEDRAILADRRKSQDIEAIFLKMREGQVGSIHLWADLGRNAIRSERPDIAYGAPSSALDFGGSTFAKAGPRIQHPAELLDPDVALAPAPDPDEFR